MAGSPHDAQTDIIHASESMLEQLKWSAETTRQCIAQARELMASARHSLKEAGRLAPSLRTQRPPK